MYLATGPVPDPETDREWAARVDAHRARRSAQWSTVESADAAAVLRETPGPVLLDCLGTWLTATIDGLDAWERPLRDWQPAIDERIEELREAWAGRGGLTVAVTNEVGWGVVPEHRSGRIFADLLGYVNQAIAAASDELVLVVAGRALRL